MWFCEECCEANPPVLVSCGYCGASGPLSDAAVEWVLLKVAHIDTTTVLDFLMAGVDPFRWYDLDWVEVELVEEFEELELEE